MYIKCCGFKEKSDIEIAVKYQADAIGFITFPKSKRYVTVEEISTLSKDIDDKVDKVAIVVNPTIKDIEALVESTSINTIQFHGDETVDFIEKVKIKYPNIKIFKALPANDSLEDNIQLFKGQVDLFLIDTPSKDYGGTGKSYDWSILEHIEDVPYLIAGGLDLEKIQQIEKRELSNIGYDISSGIETEGKKDNSKIKTLLTQLKG
ncbi:MAG TPA: phosphoribosylanthranilate isomerase [Staphylococcus sp.]|uniref:phosphoribosylanthranilate isomerase n=1 Tax=Mammaliicoccus lentus TaxID=42858 RepID=UPI000CD219F7|nr:phosphoribosylanthranilate isomerase [Mammaliicoccus lentus]MDQ7143620.1 phosphoribosylanthranilate isomerase [Mammaliicoccus lentus]POA03141.1 phosphoribosylanthranilate isomerase [Mammaliicoccus lentus]SUM51984.1 N-(5'-phosphoribosyl)anthranilate isomerase [Mammaliicoccus lentus]HBV02961.1 phosphoribosylanthranilate isomerase [Staphylococcus sp.]